MTTDRVELAKVYFEKIVPRGDKLVNPAVKDLPEWKPYSHECRYTMLLDDICQLIENPYRELIKIALNDI